MPWGEGRIDCQTACSRRMASQQHSLSMALTQPDTLTCTLYTKYHLWYYDTELRTHFTLATWVEH